MQSATLILTAKTILENLLGQCTEPQQLTFKRMYSHENIEVSIGEAVAKMDPDKIDLAISQVERTIEINNINLKRYEKLYKA